MTGEQKCVRENEAIWWRDQGVGGRRGRKKKEGKEAGTETPYD